MLSASENPNKNESFVKVYNKGSEFDPEN